MERIAGPAREKPQLIADEVRSLIIAGELTEGASLGHEPELVARFGVSRPSLREALRILEAEGLIAVVRGVRGGVVVHAPHPRMVARTMSVVLEARETTLDDVFETLTGIEAGAARAIATMRRRRGIAGALRDIVDAEVKRLADPDAFGASIDAFHRRLVAETGNRATTVVAESLHEILRRTAGPTERAAGLEPIAGRRRIVRSQERLLELIEAGAALEAEAHWRAHMERVGRTLLVPDGVMVGELTTHDR